AAAACCSRSRAPRKITGRNRPRTSALSYGPVPRIGSRDGAPGTGAAACLPVQRSFLNRKAPRLAAGRSEKDRQMLVRDLGIALVAFWLGGAGAAPGHAADLDAQRHLVNGGVVGLISGGVTGTYVRIAADLADALDEGYEMRVLPIIGKGSVRNIEDLLLLRGIDVAIVQSDVLDFYKRAELVPDIESKIHYVTRLYDEEVHVLARAEIATVDDLAGRR